ncbi:MULTISPECIES: Rid family hydrolase [unclassified Sphingomonas]|uniref:Rid family hydrolase n=1 Tax=unclassified Sphingomonas TaxID=196159 RepID=UPI0006F5A6BC|nr:MULTISPECIES: Rid family hydrolase [unclassified Sphingomonas]KQX18624.1 pyrimidine utilization protein C [Sphingomonas sp. Root1294]KQY72053.1 pyrimidine utilization protein C [Sphingomonas sp. Root50]KRB94678.1 pyrimidine utilization protein C [Sphingomonas sp. Root720]
MPRVPVNLEGLAPPPAPLSSGIVADNILYVSGILPFDKNWKTVGAGDIRIQTRQVIENIKEVVETAGGTLDDVVFNSIFLRDLDDYRAMNEVYAEYFPVNPPARYCIQASLAPPDCLLEICSTAHLPR